MTLLRNKLKLRKQLHPRKKLLKRTRKVKRKKTLMSLQLVNKKAKTLDKSKT